MKATRLPLIFYFIVGLLVTTVGYAQSGYQDTILHLVDSTVSTDTLQVLPAVQPMEPEVLHVGDARTFTHSNRVGWPFVVILIGLLILGIVRFQQSNAFRIMVESVLSFTTANQAFREKIFSQSNTSFVLVVLFAMLTALVGALTLQLVFPQITDRTLVLFLFLFGIHLAFIGIRQVTHWLFGHLYGAQTLASLFNQHSLLIQSFGAMLMLPVAFLTLLLVGEFRMVALYIAAGIMALTLVFRIGRGWLLINQQEAVSLYHVFLYFCALEIAPLLITAFSIS